MRRGKRLGGIRYARPRLESKGKTLPNRVHDRGHPLARVRWRYDREPWLIGPGMGRFRDPRDRDRPLPPFPALLAEPKELGPLPAEFAVRPAFGAKGRTSLVRVAVEPGTSLYGTGEVAGPLLRNGRRTTLWTTDAFDYTDRSPSLYQSHPWVLAVRRDGSAFGVMVETTWRCEVDLRQGVLFSTDGPSPAVIVIDRASPQDVVRGLGELTGTMPMPPRWALGYHQCRWSYEPESRVREIAAEFRERRIPCDCLWLDIDYMDGFRCFTFDEEKFPDPRKLNEDLHAEGFKTVWMIDPGIKAEPGYRVYDEGRSGKTAGPRAGAPSHFVRNKAGGEYQGDVWPGACAFPDFTRAGTRAWWGGLYREFMANGIDGVWNDMNEPAVFSEPGKAMPADCRHDADEALGGPGPHARYRNIYGMQMVRATREGIEAARPSERPFVLTRSNFLGGHRYAATWTGDNRSDWRHLAWSIPMALNLGLSGQPFCGPDIGGFVGDATPELFARWMGIGALLPFARGHSIKDSKDHEPWAFGEMCEDVCRAALERRYRLLPYLYTLFHEAHTTGLPVVRPVFFADPADARLRSVDHAFLLGGDVLVVTNNEPGGRPSRLSLSGVFAEWRKLEFGPAHQALPSLYLRPGGLITIGPVRQFCDDSVGDTFEIYACLGPNGTAEGQLYEDDGLTNAFKDGGYSVTRLIVEMRDGEARSRQEHVSGSRRRATDDPQVVVI